MANKTYDKKKIAGRASGTELVYRKKRLAVIGVWLCICIIGAIVLYFNFSRDRFIDTPVKQIQIDGGVKTGCPLDEDKEFGPWDIIQ